MFSVFWPVKLALGIFKFFLNLLVLITCVLTVIAMMGDKGWVWSLTTHFRVQYLAIQSLALVSTLLACWMSKKENQSFPAWTESRLSIIFLSVFVGLNLLQIAPYYFPGARPGVAELKSAHPVKVMHINLFGKVNHNTEIVTTAIREAQPDLLDLVEYTDNWQQKLEQSGVLRKYPYRVAGQNHIALYSKVPLRNARLVYSATGSKVANNANIIAQFTLNHKPVTILVAHPASPILPSHLSWLQDTFRSWEKSRNQLGQNLMVIGDLNTTPWSAEFKDLTRQTGLRDSQLGYGLQPSWPMLLPIIGIRNTPTLITGLFAIPIDHALISRDILVFSRKTGPFVGSDHLPLTLEIGMRPGSNTNNTENVKPRLTKMKRPQEHATAAMRATPHSKPTR